MTKNIIPNLFGDKDPTPNKLTISMGELIRDAREEAGLSQDELAKKIYRRQATLSAIELGKSETTISTLLYIAHALNKPISYFFPFWVSTNIKEEDLSPEELELLFQFRRIWDDDRSKIAINQIKALADLDEQKIIELRRKDMLENMDKDSPLYKKFVKKGIIKEDSE